MDTEEPQESWGSVEDLTVWPLLDYLRCPGKLGLTGEWNRLMIKWGHLNMKVETTAGVEAAKYWGGPNMV